MHQVAPMSNAPHPQRRCYLLLAGWLLLSLVGLGYFEYAAAVRGVLCMAK
jgi:hypothetical protein